MIRGADEVNHQIVHHFALFRSEKKKILMDLCPRDENRVDIQSG